MSPDSGNLASGGGRKPMENGKIKEPFIYALCEAMVFKEILALEEPMRKKVLESVANFVQGQLQSLPLLPKTLFFIGMMIFKFFVRLRTFSSFIHLSLDQRARLVSNWAWGRSSLFRQLFRVVRSTVFLAFYEQEEIKASLGKIFSEERAELES